MRACGCDGACSKGMFFGVNKGKKKGPGTFNYIDVAKAHMISDASHCMSVTEVAYQAFKVGNSLKPGCENSHLLVQFYTL